MTSDLTLRRVGYLDPVAQTLIAAVQEEYSGLYGGPDDGPIEGEAFDGVRGAFYAGYLGNQPIATAAWRRLTDHRAEIKRMYVVPEWRSRGYARWLLCALEDVVRGEGFAELVLETGVRQPAAIALYRSSGYTDVEAFGYYADSPLSVYLGKRLG